MHVLWIFTASLPGLKTSFLACLLPTILFRFGTYLISMSLLVRKPPDFEVLALMESGENSLDRSLSYLSSEFERSCDST